jgi:hypothetical protein
MALLWRQCRFFLCGCDCAVRVRAPVHARARGASARRRKIAQSASVRTLRREPKPAITARREYLRKTIRASRTRRAKAKPNGIQVCVAPPCVTLSGIEGKCEISREIAFRRRSHPECVHLSARDMNVPRHAQMRPLMASVRLGPALFAEPVTRTHGAPESRVALFSARSLRPSVPVRCSPPATPRPCRSSE